jgi:hypothetical protein
MNETDAPYRSKYRTPLIIAAVGLSLFIVLMLGAIVALFAFAPNLREQLPFANSSVAGAPPEAPDKFAPANSGPVTIEDSFDQPTERWEQSQTQIVDGVYEMRLDQANYDSYGLFLGAGDVRDFDIAVDTQWVSGPADAEYGIRFRQAGPGDHLMFSITNSGFYRLLRVSDDNYRTLEGWTRDERIQTGPGATNRLRVVADGPTITAFINGEEVLRYSDSAQLSGQLTLGVTTFDEPGLVVRFDNIAGSASGTTQTAEGPQSETFDLAETFSEPASARWSIGGAQIVEQSYEMFVGGAVQSWQQPLPLGSSRVGGTFVLEVDATMAEGAVGEGASAYGVMFGDGGDFDFFSLYLYPEGLIALTRNEPGGSGAIIPATELPVINTGLNATNRIRIEASGNVLKITINNEELGDLEFEDGVSFAGMAGLIASSGDPGGIRVRFDNFILSENTTTTRD